MKASNPAQLTETVRISLTKAPSRLLKPRGEPGTQACRHRAWLGRPQPQPRLRPQPQPAAPLASAALRSSPAGLRSGAERCAADAGSAEAAAVRGSRLCGAVSGADGECVRRKAEDDEDENADANEEGEGFSSVVTM